MMLEISAIPASPGAVERLFSQSNMQIEETVCRRKTFFSEDINSEDIP